VAFTEVKWKVLTPNTMEAYLEDLEAGEASVSAYYGLTTQGYENLSNNIADLKRYLSQLKSIVKYYREIDDVGENVGENSE
jgi:predicted transcriptional regulator